MNAFPSSQHIATYTTKMMRFPFSKILCFLTIVVTSVVVFSCTDHRFPPEEPDAAETVYVGDFNNLYAFDANSGTKKWEVPIAHVRRSGPTVANGIVYMSSGVNLIAVDAATGIKKWDAPIGDQDQFGYVDFVPSVVNDIVYVSVSGFINKVYALDAATGTKNGTSRQAVSTLLVLQLEMELFM